MIGRPVREWVVDGIDCSTRPGWAGALNGYIRLPEGVDPASLDLPGNWNYGPDDEGWIGFDTCHSWDSWAPEDRRRFAEYLIDEAGEGPSRSAVESMIDVELTFTRERQDRVQWTEARLEARVAHAASHVARQLRGEEKRPLELCPVHGTDQERWGLCPVGAEPGESICHYLAEELARRIHETDVGNYWRAQGGDGEIIFTQFCDYKPTGVTKRFPTGRQQ